MDIIQIDSLDFNGLQLVGQEVLTLDLSHIEKEHGVEIYGLIGFELYKGYDVLYDYENQIILLISPEYIEEYLTQYSTSAVELVMDSHIPIVNGEVHGETYQFGLDSGAESNLFDDLHYKKIKAFLSEKVEDTLIGASKKFKIIKKGKIEWIKIGDKKFRNSSTSFSELDQLNSSGFRKIDGLLGYPILSSQKTLVSYSTKQLIFID
ncbi:MAG: aspartyl protease family protein [Croceivirga sp.]